MPEFLDQSEGSRWVMIEWQREPGSEWQGVKVPTPRSRATELISDAITRGRAPKHAYRIIPTESPNGPMREEAKSRLRAAGNNGDHAPAERGERNYTMAKTQWKEITVTGLPADRTGRLKAAQAFMNVPGIEDWKWSGGMFKEPATIIYLGKLDLSKMPEGITIDESKGPEETAQPTESPKPSPDSKIRKVRKSKPRKKRGLKKSL
jgi:hypothetical protein